MLFTSVDVEALRYLNAKGEVGGELEKNLQEYLCQGYQTELMYQHRDGWFNAFVWEGTTGSLWLTAYVLSVFSQARPYITIDDDVLAAAAQWMLSHQDADGGWQPIGFVIHKEMEGGLVGNYALTAFVTIALAEYQRSGAALARAQGYLESHLAEVDSAHSLAMGAYALALLKSSYAVPALDHLLSMASQDVEGRLYWSPVEMESTSYAALALHEEGRSVQASSAAAWIAGQKNSRGGFGNTQDTVMALKALVRDAIAASEATDVAVEIVRGEEVLHTARIDAANIDVVQQFSIDPGPEFLVNSSGRGPVQAQLAKLYNVPTEVIDSRGGLELIVDYGTGQVAVGDEVLVRADLRYEGERAETNMAIAEIGIPTGLRPVMTALEGLAGKGSIQRIDAGRRAITVYIDKIRKGETITIPVPFTAAFAAQAAPVPSKAYDYYDPTIEAFDRGRPLVIGEKGGESAFLRGDATGDGQVDLSDAIALLGYLFLDAGPRNCADAMDVNDDGRVDISDPIAVVFWQFAGGAPPASPYPQTGEDLTADDLHCSAK